MCQNDFQGGPTKTAQFCAVYFAVILDSALLVHFASDIEVHFISTLYENIL